MKLFPKFFPSGKQRRDIEQAREIIERALRESRQPKGCAKSAELGADIRDRLLTVVDDLEKETGQRAVVFALDGTLTDQRLHDALRKRRDDGELLELSLVLVSSILKQHSISKTRGPLRLHNIAQNRPSHPMGRGSRSRLSLRMRLRWANNPMVAYRRSSRRLAG
jgi:hypothetical protein